MDFWFPLNNPIKPGSVHDKISCFVVVTKGQGPFLFCFIYFPSSSSAFKMSSCILGPITSIAFGSAQFQALFCSGAQHSQQSYPWLLSPAPRDNVHVIFCAFQCLFTQQQPWGPGQAIPRPLVPQSYRSIAVFVETLLLHAVLVWFVDPFFVLLPSTQPSKPATSIISLS